MRPDNPNQGLLIHLRQTLVNIIEKIDNGTCYITSDEQMRILEEMIDMCNRNNMMSKYEAMKHLHLSRSTFDRYVKLGKIPSGHHLQGFKEVVWLKSELDKIEF